MMSPDLNFIFTIIYTFNLLIYKCLSKFNKQGIRWVKKIGTTPPLVTVHSIPITKENSTTELSMYMIIHLKLEVEGFCFRNKKPIIYPYLQITLTINVLTKKKNKLT